MFIFWFYNVYSRYIDKSSNCSFSNNLRKCINGLCKLKNTPSILFWSDPNKWSLWHVWADKKFLVRQVGRWTRGQWGRWVVSSARWPPNHLQDSCLSNHHPGTNSYSASAPVRSTSTLKVRATLTLPLHYILFYFMSNLMQVWVL